ncbi:hypothetical protein MCEGE10_00670 [Flavobacteriaceae bacterium]
MKPIKLKLLALAVFSVIILNSCSKESATPAATTVVQDKQNISNTIDDFYGCLNTLNDGDLSNFLLYSLFNSTNQQYNDTYLKTLTDKFELQFGQLVLNDRMQFANNTGIYTWSNTTQLWTKVNSSSVITLKFPSRLNQVIDSELSFNSYSDVLTSYNSNNYWLPTGANLTLKRNGNLVFSLNLSNVTFDTSTNFTMPINADISIYTAPFSHTFQWRKTSNTEFQLSYNSSTPQGCGTNSVTNFKLYDADYGNITSVKDDLKTINGTLIEGNLKVVYSINVQALSAYTDPTPSQINNNSDAEVYYNDVKIGDLSYDVINNNSEIFIIYSDGSRENVEIYIGDFQNQINTIFANYIN